MNATHLQILDNLFFVQRGFLNGNHFVYAGAEPALIDTAYIGDFDDTLRHITELGVNPARVRRIVSTHTHCDHIGGNALIQKASGCDILLHKFGKYFIDTRDDWATWWRYFDQEAEFFETTAGLDDGDRVSVGPHEFEVIHTPGHASDGIVLYHRPDKILITSDALWENDTAAMTLRVEGSRALFDHLASLEKLETLDVRAVYPGHGPPFTDAAAAIARSRERVTGYLDSRDQLGDDLLKKIVIYTLMMHGGYEDAGFLPYLMTTPWFPETVDLYFHSEYEAKYNEVTDGLLSRGLLIRENGRIVTTVDP